ncbi:MAG: hypothetical protein PUC32_03530 [Oscillospiraceae bacterium]|nr:hypothetical protein [Oscillospiraceae bacterium]
MWMAQKMTASGKTSGHQLGKVMGQSDGKILVQGDTDYQCLPVSSPWGIVWLPPENATAVVLSSGVGEGQQDVCIGTRLDSSTIAPGELLLRSSGGAEIYLKNNGEVVINGQTFAKKEG